MTVANILIVDDDESMRIACAQTLEEAGYRVQAVDNGYTALEKINRESFDVVLLDLKMPGISGIEVLKTLKQRERGVAVIVITGYATIDLAVQAGRLGVSDFLSKPFTPEELISAVEKSVNAKRHELEDSCIGIALEAQQNSVDVIVGQSEAIRKVMLLIKQVAPMDSTVLITGETGSGKELAARTLHRLSRRRDQPFVVVDCGSLVESLFESELFGHTKGSFTGATDTTKGKFEMAHGGTLFLDEIANISINMQARLLRVVQEQEIFKVGSPLTKKVDVRIISATNRDLLKEISMNTFRLDLYYRLNVVQIHIPPLRERAEDIPLLAEYFFKRLRKTMKKRVSRISDQAMGLLRTYDWPGNARELKNVIERAIVVCEADELGPEHLLLGETPGFARSPETGGGSLADSEKNEILRVLKECKGNKTLAANILGINRKTLREKLQKYSISFDE
ncbi:Transcriptional regulatory protein ZraR [uncultured Desulfobacterium sp.]|uniref:Transcriptional regulatory protein ZraR n=1 Tax=uncultured Desulfobacterium sp. TaxID=201089 RepID=A0A445MUD1_9BACT|nr:Transcriptional regulatory protein ZraR [uncultured Desulfobacterium sp.]